MRVCMYVHIYECMFVHHAIGACIVCVSLCVCTLYTYIAYVCIHLYFISVYIYVHIRTLYVTNYTQKSRSITSRHTFLSSILQLIAVSLCGAVMREVSLGSGTRQIGIFPRRLYSQGKTSCHVTAT